MRLLFYFFSIFGILSFLFIIFSSSLVIGIIYPNIQEVREDYEKIAVLSGNVRRVVKASELFKSKNAKYILLSRESRLIEDYVSESKSKFVYQYYKDILVKNGVEILLQFILMLTQTLCM